MAAAWQAKSGSNNPARLPTGSVGRSDEPGWGGYGYTDWYCSKNTTCSGIHKEWNPRASVA